MIQGFCFLVDGAVDVAPLDRACRALEYGMARPGRWRSVASGRLQGRWMDNAPVNAWARSEDGTALFVRGAAAVGADTMLARYRSAGLEGMSPLPAPSIVIIDDPSRSEVLMLRDEIGDRSAVFARHSNGWVVGSDERAFTVGPVATDPQYLRALAAFRPPDARRTALSGLAELPPGCVVRFGAQASIERCRATEWPRADPRETPEDQAVRVESSIRSALHRDMDGDHPTAIAVSGGMDSSTLAAIATEIEEAPPPLLFSYRFPSHPSVDESAAVAQLGDRLGLPVHWIDGDTLGPFSRPDWLDDLNCGEPFVDPYRGLRRALHEAAADRGCRVLITGDFGDHLFLASNFWLRDLMCSHWRAGLGQLMRRLRRTPRWRTDPVLRRVLPAVGLRAGRPTPPPPWAADPTPLPMRPPWATGLSRAQEARIGGFLSAQTARAARMGHEESARYGLDLRFPYRAPVVMDAFARLPATALYDPDTGTTKRILRHVARGRVPESILARRDKTSFRPLLDEALDAGRWQALLADPAAWEQWIAPEFLARVADRDDPDERSLTAAWLAFGLQLWRAALDGRQAAIGGIDTPT